MLGITVDSFSEPETRTGRSGGGEEGGGFSQKGFIRAGSAPKSNPLPFYTPFFTEKVPVLYTFY